MKLALVSFSGQNIYRDQIKDEMVRRGHECDLLYFPLVPISKGTIESVMEFLSDYDVVHFILGFNEELTKELQVRLIERGVACPNQRIKLTNLNNKIVQMVVLAKNDISVPKSARLMNPTKEEVSSFLGFPFVLKEPVGSMGKKVVLCTEDNFSDVLEKNVEYLGQELINYTADYRVHIAGNHTFCIYERIAPTGDFRANVSLGGSMKKVDNPKLLSDLSELALRAAKAMSMDYGGIDIIQDAEGNLFVLEFNSKPGFKNVTDLTGTAFYEPIANYYESLVSES